VTLFANARLVSQLQRETETGFYSDSAFLLVNVGSGVFDEYNNEIVTVSEVPIECAFTDKPKMEAWRDFADVQMVEAEIRFAAPTPTKGNRVKVSGRFDSEYTDKTFEIIGIQDRGAMGYVCALQAVAV
jgi:hypothetical protein